LADRRNAFGVGLDGGVVHPAPGGLHTTPDLAQGPVSNHGAVQVDLVGAGLLGIDPSVVVQCFFQVAMLHDYIDPAETFVTCPNQDVAYGLGFFSLDEEPVVAQVPDFGERFWVYALYDARVDQFGHVGKQYQTKPGFYLLVGPSWNGTVSPGITAVIRSPTTLANAIPRVFMDDTAADRQAIQPVLSQIVFYPLRDFDGTMKTVDWSRAPTIPGPRSSGTGETKWVVPEPEFDTSE
jgi:hypothetical protein